MLTPFVPPAYCPEVSIGLGDTVLRRRSHRLRISIGVIITFSMCLVYGCADSSSSSETPSPAEQPSVDDSAEYDMAVPQLTAIPPVFEPPQNASTSVRISERAALRASKILKRLCDPQKTTTLSPGFQAQWYDVAPEAKTLTGTRIQSLSTSPVTLNASAFIRSWHAQLAEFVHLEHCAFKIHRILTRPEDALTWVRADVSLSGTQPDGRLSITEITAVLEGRNSVCGDSVLRGASRPSERRLHFKR